MIRVFLAGEGRNELGGWAMEPAYRGPVGKQPARDDPGVLQALLTAVRAHGWQIGDAIRWQDIPKLELGGRGKAEAKNVRGAWLYASESGHHVLVFSRDRDRNERRERVIRDTVEKLESEGAAIAGGVAIECLESWLLAIAGERRTESISPRKAPDLLEQKHRVPHKSTADMVAMIEKTGIEQIAPDAGSLLGWLERARAILEAAHAT